MNSVREKFLGSLLGIAIGDALGWPQERGKKSNKTKQELSFKQWNKSSGYGKSYSEEIIQRGSYSDDTQLTLATARALNYTNFLSYFGRIELPSWLLYERGGGGATKRAAYSWAKGIPPWKQNKSDTKKYFDAGGNGVVMRILPHAYAVHVNDEEMYQKVFLNGISTHGHPRAILSSLVYCRAVNFLLTKKDQLQYGELVDYLINMKEEWTKIPEPNNIKDWVKASSSIGIDYKELWIKTSEEILDGLSIIKKALSDGLLDNTTRTLTQLDCNNPKVKGSGVVTCLSSIYIASKFSVDPQNGLLEMAFFEGSDTDTNAAATGGLFGAIYGTDWIKDEWYEVQDANYIRQLAEVIPNSSIPERKDMWSLSDSSNFLNEIQTGNRAINTLRLGSFNNLKIVEVYPIKSKSDNKEVYVLKNDLSPTFYCKLGKTKTGDRNKNTSIDKSQVNFNLTIEQLGILKKVLPDRITLSKFTALVEETISNFEKLSVKDLDESNLDEIKFKIEKACSYKKDLSLFIREMYLYYKDKK